MAAIDQTFERIDVELRAIRAELAAIHRTQVQAALGIIGVLIAQIIAIALG